jgi:hypothetical protein
MLKTLETIELLLGLLATFILSFALPVLGFLMTIATLVGPEWTLRDKLVAVTAFVVGTPLAIVLVRTVVRVLELSQPLLFSREPAKSRLSFSEAVFQATRYPGLPWPLRPLLTLWWLLHFAGGVVVAVAAGQAWSLAAFSPKAIVVQTVLPQVLGLAYAFAGNLYLALALGVLVRRPLLLQRLWKWRLLSDIMTLILASVVLQTVRRP